MSYSNWRYYGRLIHILEEHFRLRKGLLCMFDDIPWLLDVSRLPGLPSNLLKCLYTLCRLVYSSITRGNQTTKMIFVRVLVAS